MDDIAAPRPIPATNETRSTSQPRRTSVQSCSRSKTIPSRRQRPIGRHKASYRLTRGVCYPIFAMATVLNFAVRADAGSAVGGWAAIVSFCE